MYKLRWGKGFFDEEFRPSRLFKHDDPLEELNRWIDWELFRPEIASTPSMGAMPWAILTTMVSRSVHDERDIGSEAIPVVGS